MTSPSTSLSDGILRENYDVWEEMQNHRFVRDIEADRLAQNVFHRYLVYEGAFVETAIGIFGQAMIKAPGIAQKRWLIGVLRALAEEQIGYFETTFEDLGIDAGLYDLSVPAVDNFRSGMAMMAAEGAYIDIITAMFAAEWMYRHWCVRASQKSISDPVLKLWVDLHAREEFAVQARWLKRELDTAGEILDLSERKRLSGIFRTALKLEIEFHTAAYG
jgi:thiaminase/transcriptional activator TenA